MNTVIEIRNMSRDFILTEGVFKKKKKVLHALQDLNFDISEGEIFGLLGPNGAGKTTTIKILTTLLLPTTGSAKVLGHDITREAVKVRHRINFIFGGERSLYWRLSAEDNLKYFADLYLIDQKTQAQRIPQLLELVGLTDRAKTKVETFSKGMKQRLHIARGLINDPEVIFLDEPTIGLDPESSLMIRQLIHELKERGKTILLTTHYMLEADVLCDRIAVINQGKVVALDTPQGLKKLAQGLSTLELRVYGLSENTYSGLKTLPGVEMVSRVNADLNQMITIQSYNVDAILTKVLHYLETHHVNVLSVLTRESTLEDTYLKLIGGAI